jgi:hypothetical protein
LPFDLKTFIEFEKLVSQINENNFDEIAWRFFHFQAVHNDGYSAYLKYLKVNPKSLKSLEEIPFLPISFFKTHSIKTGQWPTQRIFKSSGTTESIRSSHHLWDEAFYLQQAERCFVQFFGPLSDFQIIALLPFYDTVHSSLVAMARYFLSKTSSEYSGFFLSDFDRIARLVDRMNASKKKILLLGVSHALLDLVESGPWDFKELMVMETGGMKGRKKEITRAELHERIIEGLGVKRVSSEYGMAELSSQAYSSGDGIFGCGSAMRVVIKEVNDPFSVATASGIINVIDLANFHSCCFIETQDLGKKSGSGFEVLGRADNSEARGCNLLMG